MSANQQPPDHEQRYVVNRLVHMYQEGERQAEMVIDHLTANGFQPQHTDSPPIKEDSLERVNTFLLELGAGLRNASLHRNGSAKFFPTKLPSSYEGMEHAYQSVEPGARTSLHDKMFRVTAMHLLPGARSALGADFVRPEIPAGFDQQLNHFAAFLWERRGLCR